MPVAVRPQGSQYLAHRYRSVLGGQPTGCPANQSSNAVTRPSRQPGQLLRHRDRGSKFGAEEARRRAEPGGEADACGRARAACEKTVHVQTMAGAGRLTIGEGPQYEPEPSYVPTTGPSTACVLPTGHCRARDRSCHRHRAGDERDSQRERYDELGHGLILGRVAYSAATVLCSSCQHRSCHSDPSSHGTKRESDRVRRGDDELRHVIDLHCSSYSATSALCPCHRRHDHGRN